MLLLTGIGVVFFRESLNPSEVVGLILAIASLVLMMRFA
jgi:multidrug transporter EmrE-like cation transporter